MLNLTIENIYNKHFVQVDIPELLVNNICADISKDKSAISYLESIKLNINYLQGCLLNNVTIINKDKDNLIIYFNNNIYIKSNIKLDTLIRTLEYGNSKIKGTGIFNKNFKYIQDNIDSLYRLSKMKGGIF